MGGRGIASRKSEVAVGKWIDGDGQTPRLFSDLNYQALLYVESFELLRGTLMSRYGGLYGTYIQIVQPHYLFSMVAARC